MLRHRLAEVVWQRLRVISFVLPESVDFVTQSSPSTHAARIKCPAFLFQAEDDQTCDIADTRPFAQTLEVRKELTRRWLPSRQATTTTR